MSGTSFAWTNAFSKTPRDYHDLNTAGMRGHLELVEELGGGDWHKQYGGIHWREAPEAEAQLREVAARAQSWDYPVELADAARRPRDRADLDIPDDVAEVYFTPSEGYVEMVPLDHGAACRGPTVWGYRDDASASHQHRA